MHTRKIKIVFGLNDLAIGGMEAQFIRQLPLFDHDRFEIIVVTLFQFPTQPDFYNDLPPHIEIHKLNFKSGADLTSWWQLYVLLRALKPDIVVSSLFFSNTVFRVLKSFVGYVSIAREHNTYTNKSFLHRLVDRLLAPVSKKIVAISTSVADFTATQEGIRRSKFTIVRNGIELSKVETALETLPSRTELQQEMGFAASDHILVDIARLVPQKNHQLLVDGFILFHSIHPEYRLAIVGGGDLREELEQYVHERKAEGAIRFFGLRTDVWKFYKIADAFVSTSDIEGLSNSMLEALAAGVPLVATKTAGTDELLRDGENGFFITHSTPNEVRAALERFVAADTEALKRSCDDTIRLFDIKETVHAYESLFESVVTVAT